MRVGCRGSVDLWKRLQWCEDLRARRRRRRVSVVGERQPRRHVRTPRRSEGKAHAVRARPVKVVTPLPREPTPPTLAPVRGVPPRRDEHHLRVALFAVRTRVQDFPVHLWGGRLARLERVETQVEVEREWVQRDALREQAALAQLKRPGRRRIRPCGCRVQPESKVHHLQLPEERPWAPRSLRRRQCLTLDVKVLLRDGRRCRIGRSDVGQQDQPEVV